MDIVSEIRSSMLDELDFKKDLNKHEQKQLQNENTSELSFLILFDSVLDDLELIQLQLHILVDCSST